MRSFLTYKVAGAMATVIVVALCLTTLLNYLRYEETYGRLIENSLNIVAAEIAQTALTGIDLGLPLNASEALLPFMEARKALDPDLLAIVAYACDGSSVSQAGVLPGSFSLAPHAMDSHWRYFDNEVVAVGMGLRDSLGECAGGIAVFHSPDKFNITRANARDELIQGAAIAAAVVLPAVILASGVFYRRRNALRALENDLEHVAAGDAQDPPDASLVRRVRSALPDLADAYLAARPILLAECKPESEQKNQAQNSEAAPPSSQAPNPEGRT